MPRLPQPGGDNGNWGQILNDYLSVEHNTDGTLKKAADIAAKYEKPNTGIPAGDLSTATQTSLTKADSAVQSVNAKFPSSGNVTLTASDVSAIPTSQKGAANGVAGLDGAGKLQSAQIPDTVISATLLDAKGDLIAASADNTPVKVSIGQDGKVLSADSSASAGVSWSMPAPVTSRQYRTQAFAAAPSSPPIISVGTDGTTTIASSVLTAHNAAGAPFRYDGAPLRLPTANYYAAATLARNGAVATSSNVMRVSFDVECQVFEFRTFANGARFRLWIDDQSMSITTLPTGNSDRLVKVDFGARLRRRIVVEGDTGFCFGGVRMVASDTLAPPQVNASEKFAIVGDSYSAGITGGAPTMDGYSQTLARLLGFNNMQMQGVSGTGFVTTPNGTEYPYEQRIADLTAFSPKWILIQGSINDNGVASGTLQAAVTSYITAVRTALPAARLLCTTPLYSAAYTAAEITNASALQAACAAAGVPVIDAAAFSTGTGRVGATNGTGNADYYRDADNKHPTQAGHDNLARRLAPQVAAAWGFTL